MRMLLRRFGGAEFSRRLGAPAAALLVFTLCGCGGADDERSPPPASELEVKVAAPLPMVGEESVSAGPCTSGVVQECKVMLGVHGDVSNCFVGVQMCRDGKWGACQSPDEL
jgi:hypothetical protein